MRETLDTLLFRVRSALSDAMYVAFITPLILLQRAERAL